MLCETRSYTANGENVCMSKEYTDGRGRCVLHASFGLKRHRVEESCSLSLARSLTMITAMSKCAFTSVVESLESSYCTEHNRKRDARCGC